MELVIGCNRSTPSSIPKQTTCLLTMNANKEFSRERVLRWTLAGVVGLCLLTTVATIGVIWWMRSRPSTKATAASAPRPSSTANWSPATFSNQASDGVRQTSEKSWSIKGGRAFMQVRQKEDDSFELRFVYPFNDFLPPETVTLVRTRWGLSQVEKLADGLSITPEQLAALKAVSPATDIPVATPDRQRLRGLFDDYMAAEDKAAAEKALAEAVAGLDATYYDRTRERIDAIAEKVKSIFNEDQLAALSKRFGSRGN
jgi:hypothetical protein